MATGGSLYRPCLDHDWKEKKSPSIVGAKLWQSLVARRASHLRGHCTAGLNNALVLHTSVIALASSKGWENTALYKSTLDLGRGGRGSGEGRHLLESSRRSAERLCSKLSLVSEEAATPTFFSNISAYVLPREWPMVIKYTGHWAIH